MISDTRSIRGHWQEVRTLGRASVVDLTAGRDGVFAATLQGVWQLSPDGGWSPVGDGLGPVFCVVSDDHNDLLAGTMHGVYRWSAEAGWKRLVRIDQVVGLAIVARGPCRSIVAATAADGVYRSDDDGQQWQSSSVGVQDPRGTQLLGGTSHLLLGTQSGLYRSTDGGQVWSRVLAGLPVDLVVNEPGNRMTLFAGELCLQSSADDGESWAPLPPGVRSKLASLPEHAEPLTATVGSKGHLLVGTRRQGVLEDDGEAWHSIGGDGPLGSAARFDAGRAGEFYVSTVESGLLVSSDRGYEWDAVNAPETFVMGVAHLASGELAVYGYDGVHVRTGQRWQRILDVPTCALARVGPGLVACHTDGGLSIDNNGLGQNWVRAPGPPDTINQLVEWRHGVVAITSARESNRWHHIAWGGSMNGPWTPIASAHCDGPMLVVTLTDRVLVAAGQSMVKLEAGISKPMSCDDFARHLSQRPVSALGVAGPTLVAAAASSLICSDDGAQTWTSVVPPNHDIIGLIGDHESLLALSPDGTISRSALQIRERHNTEKDGYAD